MMEIKIINTGGAMSNMKNQLTQQIYSLTDLEKITGRNRLTLRRWWSAGKFPKPIKLNGTSLAWHSVVIANWIEQNMQLH